MIPQNAVKLAPFQPIKHNWVRSHARECSDCTLPHMSNPDFVLAELPIQLAAVYPVALLLIVLACLCVPSRQGAVDVLRYVSSMS